jgi:hypothetical protein
MSAWIEIGDGYRKFVDSEGRILAEVYALATPSIWRARIIEGMTDVDFHTEVEAKAHIERIFK